MTGTMLWAPLLLLLGLLLIAIEFLIPSGGLIAATAVVALVAAVVLAFTESSSFGITMSVITVVLVPVVLGGMVRLWPYTPLGRRMLTRLPDDPPLDSMPDNDHTRMLRSLVGQVGVARTDLLPSGLIEVGGRRHDAVAIGGAIDRGQAVEVFSIEGGKVRVRATRRTPEPAEKKDRPPSLETPLDDLALDDLENPLA
jgi:membrane-bound ClpP family serine protease